MSLFERKIYIVNLTPAEKKKYLRHSFSQIPEMPSEVKRSSPNINPDLLKGEVGSYHSSSDSSEDSNIDNVNFQVEAIIDIEFANIQSGADLLK